MRVRINRSVGGTFISLLYEGEILSAERKSDEVIETDAIDIQMSDGMKIQIIIPDNNGNALILSNDFMIVQGRLTVMKNEIRISVDGFQVFFELNNAEHDILIPLLGGAYGEEEDSIS